MGNSTGNWSFRIGIFQSDLDDLVLDRIFRLFRSDFPALDSGTVVDSLGKHF